MATLPMPRNLPARKTEMKDCHGGGATQQARLNSGFIPPTVIRELRDYTRLRQDHSKGHAAYLAHPKGAGSDEYQNP